MSFFWLYEEAKCIYLHLHPGQKSPVYVILNPPYTSIMFDEWGKWATASLDNFPKIARRVKGRTSIHTLALGLPFSTTMLKKL